MIPPADETMALSRNFFLPPASGANTIDASKIQTTKLLQDAHVLQQLQQSYDIDQFLNNPSPIDETTVTFAQDNITQALGDALRSTPYEYPSSDARTPKRSHRRPKRLSRQNTANSASSVVSRKSKRCYLCGVTDTPRWQESGFGSRLFCNVCGLLHDKKLIVRKRLAQSSRGDSMSTTDSAWS
ncbi:transcription factor [Fusarium sporotrichioides]|uniref:Transcription factor n=1 Tax=Fusarium sporotrichioides TaxID=5514 RepID=A0A395SPY9_FUSSP|nr:transcription factor [Fusarium sporotrichioides]